MKRNKVKPIALLLVMVMVLAMLGGCASGSSKDDAADTSKTSDDSTNGSEAEADDGKDEAKSEPAHKELTVYMGLPEDEIAYFITAFEKETGIKVNYVRFSAGDLLARVKAEKNNPQASVMFCFAPDIYLQAMEDGLLEDYTSPENANVLPQYQTADVEGFDDSAWNPWCAQVLTLACNRDWFEENNLEYPTTWDDLLKPEFEGQISLSHPATSGVGYQVLTSVLMRMGEDEGYAYLKELNKNVRQYTKSGSGSPMDVALGEAAITINAPANILKVQDAGYPIDLVVMDDEVIFDLIGVSLIKGAPEEERENAERFIDWLMSASAQEALVQVGRIPVNANTSTEAAFMDFNAVKTLEFNPVYVGDNRDRLIDTFVADVDSADNVKE